MSILLHVQVMLGFAKRQYPIELLLYNLSCQALIKKSKRFTPCVVIDLSWKDIGMSWYQEAY